MPAVLGIMTQQRYKPTLVLLEIQNFLIHNATELTEVTSSNTVYYKNWGTFQCHL